MVICTGQTPESADGSTHTMNTRKLRKRAKEALFAVEQKLDRARSSGRNGHFSNFGEQEIITKYIDLLKIAEHDRTIVDIGAGDGIRKSNSYNLVLNGWKVLGIEYDSRNAAKLARAYRFFPDAFACRFKVSSSNINDLLRSYSIEKELGILSLDIDGCDYWVLDSILSEFRPRLIVSEYNEKIPPPVRFVVNNVPDFTLRHHFFGYSLSKLKDLLSKYDYVLLEIEYNNVFLAPTEIARELSIDIEHAYQAGYVERPGRRGKFKANDNMELLHSLSPSESLEFLADFYSQYMGQFQIDLDDRETEKKEL